MKYRLEPGVKIGALTLLERLPKNGEAHYRWRCKCDCGAEVVKSRVVLTNKKLQHRCSACYASAQRELTSLLMSKHGLRMKGGNNGS